MEFEMGWFILAIWWAQEPLKMRYFPCWNQRDASEEEEAEKIEHCEKYSVCCCWFWGVQVPEKRPLGAKVGLGWQPARKQALCYTPTTWMSLEANFLIASPERNTALLETWLGPWETRAEKTAEYTGLLIYQTEK